MSELDIVKEQITYFKFWLGILVVTDISLFGWFIANYEQASTSLLVADLLAIAVVTAGIAELHRRIERKIESLRNL